MKSLLFLCVANSARSQMAEGLARNLLGSGFRIQSAGSQPSQVNPFAIQSMQEIGIDISKHQSVSVDSIDPNSVDTVITLCKEEVCPIFLGGTEKFYWPHEDPAAVTGSDQEILASFARIRDQIKQKIIQNFG